MFVMHVRKGCLLRLNIDKFMDELVSMESYDSTMCFCAHRELSTIRPNFILIFNNRPDFSFFKTTVDFAMVPLS